MVSKCSHQVVQSSLQLTQEHFHLHHPAVSHSPVPLSKSQPTTVLHSLCGHACLLRTYGVGAFLAIAFCYLGRSLKSHRCHHLYYSIPFSCWLVSGCIDITPCTCPFIARRLDSFHVLPILEMRLWLYLLPTPFSFPVLGIEPWTIPIAVQTLHDRAISQPRWWNE